MVTIEFIFDEGDMKDYIWQGNEMFERIIVILDWRTRESLRIPRAIKVVY